MEVEYRKMRLEDEDAVFHLRMRMWGAPSIEYVRQGARLDPQYLDHTFVVVDAAGTLLSTVRYWLRFIRDARGTPQLVGCVASVATIESARRQGHARQLMQLAIDSMREEGCAWSFLLSSDMGKPLYAGLGYRALPAPYYEGMLLGERPQSRGMYEVYRIEPPFDFEDGNWRAVRDIYSLYNAHRPLSLVRDDAYWRGYVSRRIVSRLRSHAVALFIARTPGGQAAGYLLADYSMREEVREGSVFDLFITLHELGTVPGHDEAALTLLAALMEGTAQGRVGGSMRLPRDGRIDKVVREMFGPGLRLLDCDMMALPLSEGFGEEDVDATFAAPGALFWIIDDF